MCKSFLLIGTKPGFEKDVGDSLLMHEGVVKDVSLTYGEFDIVAELETDDAAKLKKFVDKHVRNIPYLENMKPLIVSK